MEIKVEGLIPLPKSSFKRAVDVLSGAFKNDILMTYFFPDETQRQQYLPLFFEYVLKQGLVSGDVLTTSEDIEGIAIWKHSSSMNGGLLKALRHGGFKLIRKYGMGLVKKILRYIEFTSERRKKFATTPYMYLSSLAVDPEKQGQGYCSKSLRPVLAYLDRVELPCYLETESERNVSIYQHFGFEVVAECIPPETEFTHWDMIRPPQQ
ncbi:MAG: GNAT family N-acetyltransferase [Candidatus Thorarchaeota archaeon]|nr:GNAT family N-acetyltransferase [Candidatus Thorarchaeota archaeon]